MFASSAELLRFIEERRVVALDFRFTDLRGIWHHMTFYAASVDEKFIQEGVAFDGSSLPGWCSIEQSDLILKPCFQTASLDPFTAQPTLVMCCDVWDPRTQQPYAQDPRGVATRAEAFLRASGIADEAFFGPEPEFFIFEDVRFDCRGTEAFYHVDALELSSNSGRVYDAGNSGFRPSPKGGYVPVPPVDQLHDMREEMLTNLAQMGVVPEKHHHEVASCQHELGFRYDTLVKTADHLQIYKYIARNVAFTYGKTVTFMPKPLAGDNGSGMHVHQSLWKGNQSLFAGDAYAGLSQLALYYIGGILAHGKALNAFTNPTTNSYKRLVPGFEAPVSLTYASHNRSAAIRIPYGASAKSRRIEVRFPDPAANGYLALAAMLMAGLDGIRRKLDPGKAAEENLYEADTHEKQPHLAVSLENALNALDQDRAFLKEGGVFTDGLIDAYRNLKQEEAASVATTIHPQEFSLYYNI